ncbi:MAG TPA: hypothetical protein VFC39_16070 [Acidobacteriaceae bacterium]|nr:hypothetical protein [Acidobacteriaceae bacterium]
MAASILELFMLSLIDRGLTSKYALQRRGGISLGSSSPALTRMQRAGLVVQDVDASLGKRPRHELKLAAAGKRLARSGWKIHLRESDGADIESAFRIADMAVHYGAKAAEIATFLSTMAAKRLEIARSAAPASDFRSAGTSAVDMQAQWALARQQAEARFLSKVADSYLSERSSKSKKRAPTKRLVK